MPYEDLIQSVESSANERIVEIQERAQKEAEEIIQQARSKENGIKTRNLEEARKILEIERTKQISAIKEERKMQVTKVKDSLFQRAFQIAQEKLDTARLRPKYREHLRLLLQEVLEEMKGQEVVIHIDPRDESLCREILKELQYNSELVLDLNSAGGLIVHSSDGSYRILNTIETRLEKAREHLRKDLFSLLFGG